MKSRRGSNFWTGPFGEMIHQFQAGDIVVSVIVGNNTFTGVVRDVNAKLNKVSVAWGGGSVVQHDPDEIMLHPSANNLIKSRLDSLKTASRRVRKADIDLGLDIHSVSDFVSKFLEVYSQLFMFHWQTMGYAQHVAFDSANEDLEALMDTFVEVYQGKYGRISLDTPSLSVSNYSDENPKLFFQDYVSFLVDFRETLTDSELANILDEMIARVNKLLYLLTLD